MQGVRESITEFVKIVAETLPVADPIYEFGALQVLDFDNCYVESAGEEDFPHTVVGIGSRGESIITEQFLREIAEWKRRWFFHHGRSWRQFRMHCTPPILRGFSRQISRYFG